MTEQPRRTSHLAPLGRRRALRDRVFAHGDEAVRKRTFPIDDGRHLQLVPEGAPALRET
eukprot:CAMPEP_0185158930 /NCGR_PEP_ID=MMETSP1139-20130426/2728_1 /TAXON_ID=298111 /ORGANISM="Pavlova sp., Strain CCMP459" /LENGTH=58 /DNA_ID=CAMNT_0027724087 /DNA_START=26 /DNA_END=202 /DNA_ORIENTATION=+